MFKKNASLILFLICLVPSIVYGKDPMAGSGLPLPRFVSLRTNEVNLRTGPGTRYPIEWVFRQKELPIEITAEYDVWRRIRDWEGTEGWIHKGTLSGRRTAIIKTPDTQKIRTNNKLSATVKALVDSGAIGQILSCQTNWCKVQFKNVKGFLPKTAFWGAYRGEQFD